MYLEADAKNIIVFISNHSRTKLSILATSCTLGTFLGLELGKGVVLAFAARPRGMSQAIIHLDIRRKKIYRDKREET